MSGAQPDEERAALMARVRQDPDDDAACAVLGDLLLKEGDVWGELIAIQRAAQAASTSSDERRRSLDEDAQRTLAGAGPALLRSLARLPPDEVELEWSRGHVAGALLRHGEAHIVVERLRELAALPVAHALRRLTIALRPIVDFDMDEANDGAQLYGELLEALAATALPPTLRELTLGDTPGDLINGHVSIHGLAAALCQLPTVDTLTVQIGRARLGHGPRPSLRTLALHLSDMELATLDELIAGGAWPRLERLELWTGGQQLSYVNESYDAVRTSGRIDVGALTLAEVASLRVSDRTARFRWPQLEERLPRLVPDGVTHLGLGNLDSTDELAAVLPKAPWLPRLRVLDLSHGSLTARGAESILRKRASYAHLEALILDDNSIPEELAQRLRDGLPQARVGRQRLGDRSPAFETRYVASIE